MNKVNLDHVKITYKGKELTEEQASIISDLFKEILERC